MTTTEERNKEVMRRYEEEVWNERNLDVIEEVLAEEFVLHYPNSQEVHGPEEFREKAESNQAAFPDSSQTTEDIIAEDDMVVMRLVVRGTHGGEFMGYAPTGKEFEIEEVHIVRIEDGKIVEQWSQADMMGLMEQLGLQ